MRVVGLAAPSTVVGANMTATDAATFVANLPLPPSADQQQAIDQALAQAQSAFGVSRDIAHALSCTDFATFLLAYDDKGVTDGNLVCQVVPNTGSHYYVVVLLTSFREALDDYLAFRDTDAYPVAIVFSDGLVAIANDPPRAT
jgi:hypothetical protein